jgi:hypothetical protein
MHEDRSRYEWIWITQEFNSIMYLIIFECKLCIGVCNMIFFEIAKWSLNAARRHWAVRLSANFQVLVNIVALQRAARFHTYRQGRRLFKFPSSDVIILKSRLLFDVNVHVLRSIGGWQRVADANSSWQQSLLDSAVACHRAWVRMIGCFLWHLRLAVFASRTSFFSQKFTW